MPPHRAATMNALVLPQVSALTGQCASAPLWFAR